jgi:hypothetical protein
MNRRQVLKNLGYTFGATAMTPTVLSILQSCSSSEGWAPKILPFNQVATLEALMDVILPKTDTPSASELNLIRFVDAYMDVVISEKDQKLFLQGFEAFTEITTTESGNTNAKALEAQLFKFLRAEAPKKGKWMQDLYGYLEAVEKGEGPAAPKESLAYNAVSSLRDLCITGFRGSEYIGEQVLAYAPIPGQQQGCVDLMETTGGKSWSL